MARFAVFDNQFERSEDRMFFCPICRTQFKDSNAVRKHIFVHAIGKLFCCGICNQKFQMPRYLIEHIRQIHKQPKSELFECFLCNKSFLSSERLKRHLKTHAEKKTYLSTAKKEKKISQIVLESKHKVIEEKLQTNDVVSTEEFDRFKAELGRSMDPVHLISTPESRLLAKFSLTDYPYERGIDRSFMCPVCGKPFKDANMTRRHIYSHATTNFFQCGLCDKRFRLPRYLRKHLHDNHDKGHESNRSFECHLCHKPFLLIGHLIRHMNAHLGIKKKYLKRSNPNSLPRLRPIDQPKLCEICGRTLNSSTIKEHMKIHEAAGTRLHRCSVCDKSFTVRRYLMRHIRQYHRSHYTANEVRESH